MVRLRYSLKRGCGGRVDDRNCCAKVLRRVFKKYSRMKLQMKREALKKLNRKANENQPDFDTERRS